MCRGPDFDAAVKRSIAPLNQELANHFDGAIQQAILPALLSPDFNGGTVNEALLPALGCRSTTRQSNGQSHAPHLGSDQAFQRLAPPGIPADSEGPEFYETVNRVIRAATQLTEVLGRLTELQSDRGRVDRGRSCC